MGIRGKLVSVTAYQVDDEPDNPDEDENWGKGEEKPEAAGEDGAAAMNNGAGGDVCIACHDGDVAADAGIFGQVQVSGKDGYIACDIAVGVDGDTSAEDRDISLDIAVDMDRAEGAGDVAGGLTFGDGDIAAEAGAVLVGKSNRSNDEEEKGEGEE
jgi:hypothetical protein